MNTEHAQLKLAHTSTYVLLEIRWAATVNIKCILVHWQELEGKLFCKFKILVMQLWKNVLGQLTSFYLLPLGNLSVSVWMNWRSNFASNCIKMAKKTHYSKHRMRQKWTKVTVFVNRVRHSSFKKGDIKVWVCCWKRARDVFRLLCLSQFINQWITTFLCCLFLYASLFL